MNDNISLRILDFYFEIDQINNDINYKISDFITKATELVELSKDAYQIEKTLSLNKISLKGYILETDCCIGLNDNNINNYSIDELNNYLIEYEKSFGVDYSKYFLALSLYRLIEDIEKQIDIKIDLEIEKISKLIPNISNIKGINSSENERLYINLKSALDNYFKLKMIDEKAYNICIQVLNDIFNFYINGYPNIPEEYLYCEDN